MHEPNWQQSVKSNVLSRKSLSRILGGIIFLGLIMVPMIGAQTGTMVTDLEYADIDWSTGVVRAKGLGVPPSSIENPTQRQAMAKRAARIVAYQRLLEITQGIKIDSRTLVKNLMVESEEITAKVKGVVDGARVINEKAFKDGSFEVMVEMELKNIERSIPHGAKLPPYKPIPQDTPIPQGMNYTGLVINAQGLDIVECLAPKIKTEDGQFVYARDLWPEGKNGTVGYVKGISMAEMHDKVKSNPLIVKALRMEEGSETDLVIDQADAQSIYLEPKNEEFLQQGKVVIAY